jgi:hypothetical protein
MLAGRKRWLDQWRRDKAAGLPVVPFGGIRGRRKHEPIEISRVRVKVKNELAIIGNATDAEHFDRLRFKALTIAEQVLDLPNDLDSFEGDHSAHHKRLVLQARMAESIISDSIKIDAEALRHQDRRDLLDTIKERLDNIKLPQKS